ncbi:uncharacterized protein EAF01_004986 [Botrytis porri]|uniref:uncharacterized protein n=1 Tax=Botrytis porri TaxID=87229 RepID=UPI001900A01E|nr:uncharacterized protein EAF01_004986 [Botrytis porri]KAF7907400.1 hypothetical protein EAF01_004986 [Botrytis porri]
MAYTPLVLGLYLIFYHRNLYATGIPSENLAILRLLEAVITSMFTMHNSSIQDDPDLKLASRTSSKRPKTLLISLCRSFFSSLTLCL